MVELNWIFYLMFFFWKFNLNFDGHMRHTILNNNVLCLVLLMGLMAFESYIFLPSLNCKFVSKPYIKLLFTRNAYQTTNIT